MTTIGQLERTTQNRVVMLLANQLGWQYLGNWHDRESTKSHDLVLYINGMALGVLELNARQRTRLLPHLPQPLLQRKQLIPVHLRRLEV